MADRFYKKFRIAGPGKAPDNGPNEDFQLNEDEYFGEETAGLYLPSNDHLILQYNHHGPRLAAIEYYLNICAFHAQKSGKVSIKDIELIPIARADAVQQLKKANFIKRLEFTLFVPGAIVAQGVKRKSLGEFLEDPVVASARTISVQISAGHSKSLNIDQAKMWASELFGLGGDISHLQVRALEDEDAPSATIDLLESRLVLERAVSSGGKGRHARNHRWAALRSAYDEWAQKELLP